MLVAVGETIPSMSSEQIDLAIKAQEFMLEREQIDIRTYHTLHGGVYTRTILLQKDEALTGATIKVPTTLIVSGSIAIYIGSDVAYLSGYNVIPASAFRKQVMVAIEDTYITMVMETKSTTVTEAEDEFTDESHLLMSRKEDAKNHIVITGE